MMNPLYIRTSAKAMLFFLLLLLCSLSATTLASSVSHYKDYTIINPGELTLSSLSSKISVDDKSIILPDTNSNSFFGYSRYVSDNSSGRNSYPNLIMYNEMLAPPIITCPGNIASNTDPGLCTASINVPPPATSDPDNNITIVRWRMTGANLVSSPLTGINYIPSPFEFKSGTTTVTYTVIDATNSASTCSFTVVVTDTEKPSITCPANQLIPIPSCAVYTDTISFSLLSVSDNCGIASFNSTAPYTYPIGNTAVTWTATDVNGNSNQCTQVVTVVNAPPMVLVGSGTQVSCAGGSDGTASVETFLGTPPYTYEWNTVPVQNTQTAVNLAVGTYQVKVTDPYGCSDSTSITITLAPNPIILTTSQIDVACFGNSTGSATVFANGGSAPYTYAWLTTPIQSSATAINLAAGTYSVAVFDSKGCFLPTTVTITQPATAVSGSIINLVPVICKGSNTGSVTVAGSGGILPYQYSINGGSYQASGVFNNLIAGSYTVSVRDANNCPFTVPVIITEPAVALSAVTTQTNVLCNGQLNGSATVTASGGTLPYSYSWNTVPAQLTPTASNLAAGIYTVTVTDAVSCSVPIIVTITQPDPLAVIISQVDVACFGDASGSATAIVSGGTPPYSYAWLTSPIQTTATVANLIPGTYTVGVFDSQGCFQPGTATITQPVSALTASVSNLVDADCAGNSNGSVTVVGSGGTPGYQYNINGGAYQASGTFSSLSNGNYIVNAKDQNNCIFPVPVQIAISGILVATNDTTSTPMDTPVSGNVMTNDRGLCDPPVTVTSSTAAQHGSVVIAPNGSATYTPAPGYIGNDFFTYTLTDNNGDVSTATVFITVTPVNQPPNTVNESIVLCPGTTFVGTVSNGGTVFNGETDPENNLPLTVNSTPVQAPTHGVFTITNNVTGTFNYTPVSNYSGPDRVIVSICDSGIPAGCSNDTIFIVVSPAVVANAGPDQTLFPGMSTTLSGSASGGSGIYTWSWIPANKLLDPSIQNPETVVLNATTIFNLTVMDITTSCKGVDTVSILIQGNAIIAVGDYDTTLVNTPLIIDVLANDINPDGDPLTLSICGFPSHGLVVLNTDKTITYTPYADYVGDDMFCYRICNVIRPTQCSDTLVYINVKLPSLSDIYVYNGISPNGDGNNDTWIIKGIEKYPENTILIYNRWGDKIREFVNYNNTTVSWDGKNENNKPLPNGTYYYLIEVKNVGTLKGWILIRGV
jgi:gliding motility-associated-like protein